MTEALIGIQLFFTVLLGFTAVVKLTGLSRFELTLVQLFGTRPFTRLRVTSRIAGAAVAGYELVLAALLGFAVLTPVSTALLIGTMALFAAVVWRAWRLHVGCGCFPDRRPTEVSSLVRSAMLVVLAAVLLVFGIPSVTGGGLLLGALWALGIAGVVYLSYTVTRLLVRRHNRTGTEAPKVAPVAIVAQILAERGRPAMPTELAGDDDLAHGWVEVVPLCRATGLAVSTLYEELELRSTVASTPLLPVGSRPERVVATSLSGAEITTATLTTPTMVLLFSATCTRCPKHVPEVVEFLREQELEQSRVLVVVSGDGPGAQPFVDALADLAIVVIEPELGPLTASFQIREFPAFYVMDAAWTVVAAARVIGELRMVAA